jgi:hypothetical protein
MSKVRGKQSWYVIAKISGDRFETVADARAHGNREYGSYGAACALAREFRKSGFPAKVKKAKATI